MNRIDPATLSLTENVIRIGRTAKVVGDGTGHVGIGLGKAKDIQAAIKKGTARAQKEIVKIPLMGTTIPHEVIGHFGAGRILLKPAAPGTGVIAGGASRAVLEAAGVKDVLTKSLGSTNTFNLVYATMKGLTDLRTPEDISRLRGKPVELVRKFEKVSEPGAPANVLAQS